MSAPIKITNLPLSTGDTGENLFLRSDNTWTTIDLQAVTKDELPKLVAEEVNKVLLKLLSEGKIKVTKEFEPELAEQFAKEL